MSFNVDISKLYTVVASGCTNQANKYCPVQMRVNDKRLIEHYGGTYLVQLWSADKELVYQTARKQPLSNRNLTDDYFVFQEDDFYQEEGEEPEEFGNNSFRRDKYTIVQIIEGGTKEITVEIIEDTVDDPNAFPSPIEHVCTIWQRKDETGKEDGIFLLVADQRTISFISLSTHLSEAGFGNSATRVTKSENRTKSNKLNLISV